MARYPEIYRTKEWKSVRRKVIVRSHGLCERCKRKGKYKPGKIVHHTIWISDANKADWSIIYSMSNLEYVCNDCHEEEHDRTAGLMKFIDPPEG